MSEQSTEFTPEEMRLAVQFLQLHRAQKEKPQETEMVVAPSAVIDTIGVPSPPPPVIVQPAQLVRIDLGCGQSVQEGYQGVDRADLPGVIRFDLFSGEAWPFEDNSVDELRASHLIEHIPMVEHSGQDGLFRFFDEAWRVAKKGATFHLIWPCLQSVRAFMDPTHRRFIPQESLLYLNAEWRNLNKLDHYPIKCGWVTTSSVSTISQEFADRNDVTQADWLREKWNIGFDFHAVLKAVK